ncbi:thioesterase family protein [Niveomyces insectorum RCEF 264]|uniref:Thioesterase family protein n=1 Tax=Niveomyces insectorum RCEF 264 TaxID=1081102 RepID=A0A167SQC1_9HYPO|nr:thioesterase family protein [Niveomyces insectorum RCEF 264]
MPSLRAAVAPFRPALSQRLPVGIVSPPHQLQPWRPISTHSSGTSLLSLRGQAPAPRPRPGPAVSPWSVPSLVLVRTHAKAFSSATSPYPEAMLPQPPPPPPPRHSLVRSFFSFVFRGWLYTTLGAGLAVLVCCSLVYRDVIRFQIERKRLTAVVTDLDAHARAHADSDTDTATDDVTQTVRRRLLTHPFVRALDDDPRYRAVHPHHVLPPGVRRDNLTGGTLIGPGLMAVAPFIWFGGEGGGDDGSTTKRSEVHDPNESVGDDLVMVVHAGAGLCGHPGIVHGGFVATLLDEGLARCGFRALPYKMGVTASLKIDYRAPTPADTLLVLRATTTRVEGRKVWVTGRLETLPEPNSGTAPVLLAEAEGLFISPRSAWKMSFLGKLIE